MIKIDMTSTDIDRQAELLKYYPEVIVKHYKPALLRVSAALSSVIEPMIPSGITGDARSSFGSKVTGRTLNTIQADIGWYDDDDPFYVKFLENGVKPHDIRPQGRSGGRRVGVLSWMDGGDFVFSKVVHHPGTSKVGMLAAGWSALQPLVEIEMQRAGEAVLKEMEIE
jgi:hypothetical protein